MKTNLTALFLVVGIVLSLFFAAEIFAWTTANGDHGWTCFPAGTKIFMADKTEKNIEDVAIGDIIMGYDGTRMMPAVVEELEAPIRDHLYRLTFVDGTTLRLTNEHPLFTKEGWKSINPKKTAEENPQLVVGELKIGDFVFTNRGTYTKIISMHYIPGNVQTYNLKKVSRYRNFFADSYLAHNKKTTYDVDGNRDGIIGDQCPAKGCGSGGGGKEECGPATCASFQRGCGLKTQAYANGCGGVISCPATAPCATPTPVKCARIALKCSTRCGLSRTCVDDKCGGQSCCPATAACPTPLPCLRSKGDANCDGVVNIADYDIFRSMVGGLGDNSSQKYSADFNADGKVNMIDYEIWRNTFYN
ncbi:hypothetical protein COS52_02545 [Candidatus Roizmanbacteria bacterium CG03_land_8_20_14_0_80_39_12]|uniref:Dockerin domain-containing protein n=1 Tax=Candidatus Roizmanbacteria bacterium CG03_land_8_20_14_0_80_39_12 TaxID=1974847 RepID=A0A2M7BSK0_9BACT|nr:MAG: hypothetical protein COS52_02545 [Candidatus Roizmanbacteria bacterium CG03_land_8_20_14_0_80_39_12]